MKDIAFFYIKHFLKVIYIKYLLKIFVNEF